jgi:hypothetical protein
VKIRPHKIGSVTHRLKLGPEVEYSRLVEVRSGQVLVVKALEEKRVYDVIELSAGRQAHIGVGDVLVGALGRRDALRGFVGRVPEKVKAGDTLHVLNLGGLIGEAIGGSKEVGEPLRVEVLGMVVRDGKGVNIADAAIPDPAPETPIPPVILVSGTCMSAGKTHAACETIARLTARGYTCAGVKLTGVAALRDTLNMGDHGAVATLSFIDCGYPSTAGIEDVAPIAKKILRSIEREAGQELDVVVAEVGDGIIGCYGVDSILRDPEFRSLIRAQVLCATDLVAAWGGVRWLEGIDLPVHVVAGPATDNEVGIRYIEGELGIPAANARTDPQRFVDLVEEAAFTGAPG